MEYHGIQNFWCKIVRFYCMTTEVPCSSKNFKLMAIVPWLIIGTWMDYVMILQVPILMFYHMFLQVPVLMAYSMILWFPILISYVILFTRFYIDGLCHDYIRFYIMIAKSMINHAISD